MAVAAICRSGANSDPATRPSAADQARLSHRKCCTAASCENAFACPGREPAANELAGLSGLRGGREPDGKKMRTGWHLRGNRHGTRRHGRSGRGLPADGQTTAPAGPVPGPWSLVRAMGSFRRRGREDGNGQHRMLNVQRPSRRAPANGPVMECVPPGRYGFPLFWAGVFAAKPKRCRDTALHTARPAPAARKREDGRNFSRPGASNLANTSWEAEGWRR